MPSITRAGRLRMAAPLIGLVLIAGALTAAPAHAKSANFGAKFAFTCKVFGLAPPPPTVNSSLRKVTYASAGVSCPPLSSDTGSQKPGVFIPRTVEIQYQLRGSDPLRDDVLQSVKSQIITVDGKFGLSGVPTKPLVAASRATCNEDSPGGDEVYSRVRGRLVTSDPSFGFWSEWTNSETVSYDC
jgi:hypothetical protein